MTEMLERFNELKSLIITTQKAVLNIDEVAVLTGLSKSTIYQFTHRGRIPHYRQAKRLFFDRLEIEQWMKSNRGYLAEDVEKQSSTYVALNKGGEK